MTQSLWLSPRLSWGKTQEKGRRSVSEFGVGLPDQDRFTVKEDKGSKLPQKQLLFKETMPCSVHCAGYVVCVGHRIHQYDDPVGTMAFLLYSKETGLRELS